MSKNKMYLYVVHTVRIFTPKVTDLLENELLKDVIQQVIDSCTKPGETQKQLKKLCKKYQHEYVEEEVYFNDHADIDSMSKASLVIDVLENKVLKNRNDKITNEEILKIYLDRYKMTIDQVQKQLKPNEKIIID